MEGTTTTSTADRFSNKHAKLLKSQKLAPELENQIFLSMPDSLFPEDIIYRILSRLPIKSLARFRLVCKLWLKYINHPYLSTIHVKEEPTPIMFQQFHDKIKISFLRGVQKEAVMDLCYKKGPYDDSDDSPLLASCNGLTLVSYEQYPFHAYRFAVINPLTKQCHNLPPFSIKLRAKHMGLEGPCQAWGIGFDVSTNTFKAIFFILKNPYKNVSQTMVHTSGMNMWREMAQAPPYTINGAGVFSHGRLHWLVSLRCESRDSNDGRRRIVWFDVKTEEFGLMVTPKLGEGLQVMVELIDLKEDEVGLALMNDIFIKLWILKYEENWVLHCCVDVAPMAGCEFSFCDVEVSGYCNKDGDILLNYNSGERMFIYTLKTGDLRQVLEQHGDLRVADIRMYQSSLFLLHTTAYSVNKR